MTEFQFMRNDQFYLQYIPICIKTVSSQLLLCSSTFVFCLAGLGQNSSVLCMLLCPNVPINQLKLDQQSRQQALRTYCPNIYTVISARLVLFGHDFSLNESSLSSAASVSPIPPLPTGLVIGRVPRGPRRPRPHSVAISASSSSSCGQLQHSPVRRKLREKREEK